ncbi:MAG: hypothetical protein MJA29_14335 [Candidatus Omnitrophica bacterium]|nr:hypothetical protein [Candidatus Omnitrophota bacterium]
MRRAYAFAQVNFTLWAGKVLSPLGGCRTRPSRSGSGLRQLRHPRAVASLHGDALEGSSCFT